MATNMSTQLRNDLLSAEISFISSIQSDQNAIANFSAFWDNLNVRIEEAATSQLLDDETCAAAQSVAGQISALAESFLEMRLVEDDILTRHNHEIDEILQDAQDASDGDVSRLAILPVPHSITSQIIRSRTHSTPTDGSNRQSKSVKALSGWLLKHVHNPYPSQNRKLQLARSADVSMKAVNNWFSTARRQIGWTAFCKRHFKGNRQLAVDCAHQIFNQDATSFSSDLVLELLEVKLRAEKLCGSAETRNTTLELLRSLDQESLKRRSTCIEENRRKKRRCVSSISSDQTSPVFGLSESMRLSPKARSISTETTADMCGNVSHLCNEEKLSPCRDLRSRTSSTTSASRTASVSSTDSSRETTEELPTPVIPTYDLLPTIVDSCIDSWISSVATETQACAMKDTGFGESRKRSICESNLSTSPKRRRTDSEVLPTRTASELLSTPCQQMDDWFDLLPQFDFEFPPPVSINSNIMDGEALHLRVFDCEGWKQTTDPSLYAANEYAATPLSFESAIDLGEKNEDVTSLWPNSHLRSVEDRASLGDWAGVHFDFSCFGQEINLHEGVPPTLPELSAPDAVADCESSIWGVSQYQPESCTESQVQPDLRKANLFRSQQLEKLERIKCLLSEAAELQQEVFSS